MNNEIIDEFRKKLLCEEKSAATIEKYIHDLKVFREYADQYPAVTKTVVIKYKHHLMEMYAPASVNSMLAAINCFFKEFHWDDCIVKAIKIQYGAFRSKERELSKTEYYQLLQASKNKKNLRLYYIMQTICSTGIRVSELRFVTVGALSTRRAIISLKGKTRTVILPMDLCKKLKHYVKENGIQEGSVFVTRNGNPVDRSNILHEMKELSKLSGVAKEKIFPHNLRHLFACVYYQTVKDLSRLADLLGHSNINTTRIYTKISSEVQERQIENLRLII